MGLAGHSITFKVQPGFEGISDYLLKINSRFPNINFIIQNRRNDIRVDTINGYQLVIKSFKGMYWPNRLAYSLFRKSKAQRSFETSIRLESMAIHVPTPVAYIDYYEGGILQSSYFVSLYQDHEDLQTSLSNDSSTHRLSKLFAGFTFHLHQAGVYHDDFSKGNILCVSEGRSIHFSLVDLNRVRFRSISFRAGVKSLSKLGLKQADLKRVLKIYTQLWGQSFGDAIKLIKEEQKAWNKVRNIRLFFKRLFFPSRLAPSSHP